jgi:hypothetical protein
MKLKDLKKQISKLTKDQLEKEVFYYSSTHGISGIIQKAGKSTTNLYYTGEDDPVRLYTKKELKEDYENDEIKEFTLEIAKGDFLIQF